MKKEAKKKALLEVEKAIAGYDDILSSVVELLEAARHASARAVNALMTATYWEIGRRIVEYEQRGRHRADYGEALLKRLAADLTAKFKRGFSRQNLQQMRSFYLNYPSEEICQTLSGKSRNEQMQTPSVKSQARILQTVTEEFTLSEIAARFPLSWSHYVRLMSVKNPKAA